MKYSIIGTLIWAAIITGLGLLFGELILKYIEKAEHYIIVGILVVAALILLYRIIKRNNK